MGIFDPDVLPEFDAFYDVKECPKCGFTSFFKVEYIVGITCHGQSGGEHLHMTCRDCGYRHATKIKNVVI